MRIIGGSAKGTALLSPVGKGMTRPTLGRVRESIFNVLANVGMKDTRVLDIFAGTGAMGLEALSRGAAHATFLDKATCKLIRENAVKCHVETGRMFYPAMSAVLWQSLQGTGMIICLWILLTGRAILIKFLL